MGIRDNKFDGSLRVVANVIPESFRNVFLFDRFNEMQSAIFDQIYSSDVNITLAAPTGCGKTVIFELAIIKMLIMHPKMDAKCIYIAPNKALCQQKVVDWRRAFGQVGAVVVEITGDSPVDNTMRLVAKASIIVTTPEKWDSLTRSWNDHVFLLGCIDLLLIDEIHHLNEDRGATLETVVVRMRTLNDIYHQRAPLVANKRKRMRIVALSAVLPNVSDIGQWLQCSPEAIHYFDDSFRPVPLVTHTLAFGSMKNQFLFEKSLDDKVLTSFSLLVYTHLLLHGFQLLWNRRFSRYSSGKPVVVFCQSKKGAEALCASLCRSVRLPTKHSLASASGVSFEDPKLRGLVSQGFAFHHAGLPADDRALVEQLYMQGIIQILCTTSTLAHGVNLPAHLVIIKGTNQWRGGTRGYEKMPKSMILQMVGRAGRPGFDTDGVAVIMTSSEDKAAYTDLALEVVESSLPGMLVEALCAEISQHVIQDISDGIAWLKNTFFYIRVRQNPTRYGFNPSLTSAELRDQLMTLCVKSLEKLSDAGVVKFNPDSLTVEPLPETHVMSRHMIKLATMAVIMHLSPSSTIFNILTEVCGCAELAKPVKRSDKKVLNEMMKSVRYPLRIRVQEPNHKAYVLLLSAVDKTTIADFSLRVEQSEIVEQCTRVLSALFDYSRQSEKGQLLESCLLLQRSLLLQMWEHVSDNRSVFELCRRISPAVVPRFVENGIPQVDDVLNISPKELQRTLKCSNEDVRNIIRYGKELKGSRLVASATLVSKYELRIDVESGAIVDSQQAQLPVFRGSKDPEDYREYFTIHMFHLICYESETSKLLCYRKFPSSLAAISYSITLSDAMTSKSHMVICLLCVDTMGLDFIGNSNSAKEISTQNPHLNGVVTREAARTSANGRDIIVVSPSTPVEASQSSKHQAHLLDSPHSAVGSKHGSLQYDSDDNNIEDMQSSESSEASRRKHLVQQKLSSSYFQPKSQSKPTASKRKSSAITASTKTSKPRPAGSGGQSGIRPSKQDVCVTDGKRACDVAPLGGMQRVTRQKKSKRKSEKTSTSGGMGRSRGEDFGMFEYKSFRERAKEQEEGQACGGADPRVHGSLRRVFELESGGYDSPEGMQHAMNSELGMYDMHWASSEPLSWSGQNPTSKKLSHPASSGLSRSQAYPYPSSPVEDVSVSHDLQQLRRKASEVQTSQSSPIKRCRSRLIGNRPGGSTMVEIERHSLRGSTQPSRYSSTNGFEHLLAQSPPDVAVPPTNHFQSQSQLHRQQGRLGFWDTKSSISSAVSDHASYDSTQPYRASSGYDYPLESGFSEVKDLAAAASSAAAAHPASSPLMPHRGAYAPIGGPHHGLRVGLTLIKPSEHVRDVNYLPYDTAGKEEPIVSIRQSAVFDAPPGRVVHGSACVVDGRRSGNAMQSGDNIRVALSRVYEKTNSAVDTKRPGIAKHPEMHLDQELSSVGSTNKTEAADLFELGFL